MNALRNFVLIAALSWLFSAPAFAGSGTITVLDATSGSHTYAVVTNGGSQFIGMGTVCDGTAAAQCAAVKAASTAAGATDPALVVAISPNNTVAATQSGTWNITNVSGTVSLPTGAATSALQTTINTTLGSPMQNSGGSVTANAGTNLNTSALATHADIVTNSATSAHTCSTGGASLQGCLGQIDDDVKAAPSLGTSGGITPLKLNALSNSAVAIKAAAGQLFMLQCGNTNASEEYVQIYNVASGSVTVGTTASAISIPIAATSTGGFALSLVGMQFGTAISAAATTSATGGSAPSTALDCNVGYN